MPTSFTVAFVLGATPGKWSRVWRERLPESPIELVPSEQAEALAMLAAGTADVALVRLPIDRALDSDRPLAAIPLYTERAVAVIPKDHELAQGNEIPLAELAAVQLIDDEWRAAVDLVAANVGITVIPQAVARALMRKDVVSRIVSDGPEWQVAVAWRDGSVDPLVEEFIGIVRGRTAKSSRGTAGGAEAEEAESPKRASRASGTKKAPSQRAAARSSGAKAAPRRPDRPAFNRNKRRKG
ncbi:LysR family transcriptional regulator [Salinibacterium sp. UTAS2018]|uniref:LysR family transcriptional regulator substrate-binding protein n=1 Tax=Salinibacterium sp. UTAS2018 TaxID=2508880 RepID=UPI001009762F|nr:LysR family transcriptional regulator substrate-binding protein [Salinibacterium sp. UTAS2018]QAV69406.1 LysR family transcriptional regulator [Salinibacterium sp. UTAS2018]